MRSTEDALKKECQIAIRKREGSDYVTLILHHDPSGYVRRLSIRKGPGLREKMAQYRKDLVTGFIAHERLARCERTNSAGNFLQ